MCMYVCYMKPKILSLFFQVTKSNIQNLKWDSNTGFYISKIMSSTWSILNAVLKRLPKRGFCSETEYKHIFGWINIIKKKLAGT